MVPGQTTIGRAPDQPAGGMRAAAAGPAAQLIHEVDVAKIRRRAERPLAPLSLGAPSLSSEQKPHPSITPSARSQLVLEISRFALGFSRPVIGNLRVFLRLRDVSFGTRFEACRAVLIHARLVETAGETLRLHLKMKRILRSSHVLSCEKTKAFKRLKLLKCCLSHLFIFHYTLVF